MDMAIKKKALTIAIVIFLFMPNLVQAGQFVAYSLNVAEQKIKSGEISSNVIFLGGITHPLGVVFDQIRRDVILVGEQRDGGEKVTLDDFVVAMRAILDKRAHPLVSIDQSKDTPKTGKQKVRFEGGIDNTQFGKDLFEADVVLKKMGLGKLNTPVWGVNSYFDMSAEDWKKTGKENNLETRFWFVPSKEESLVGVRKGVGIVDRLRITVKSEVMNKTEVSDEVGNRFAAMIASHFDDISMYYKPLRRLDTLFRLTGLAEAIDRWQKKFGVSLPDASFWLEDYKVKSVDTPKKYPLLQRRTVLQRGNVQKEMTIAGGIKLEALIIELQDKSLEALREIVIGTRPSGTTITWKVPLDAWGKPEIAQSRGFKKNLKGLFVAHRMGMNLNKQFSDPGHPAMKVSSYVAPPHLSGKAASYFNFADKLNTPKISPNVGGVMLQGMAKVEGAGGANVDIAQGKLSLIVDGKNARLAPETFRKFVTALWAVYFSNQDPGISIDPIAPGAKKHLVRYIGKVLNTDLGRVMREADYLMKKWSIGTERPDFPWFKNPDDISGERGVVYVGAWSRFWLVPEDMIFKRSGDMLLFDKGRMRVKTEYMFKNKGMQADPANEEFANLFTKHYSEITEKYPVYKELFEYAKLVSLAKYLKERGVPLFWFLIANRDLVLTEDSPGTVNALAKGSKHFKGVYIEGGVDLGVKGNYVYDAEAIEALRKASSKASPSATITSLGSQIASTEEAIARSVEGLSFDVEGKSYTVAPQHSLSSGKDKRGIRYQTDIAVRWKGFRVTKETLMQLKTVLFYKELSKRIGPRANLKDLEPRFDALYKESMRAAKRTSAALMPMLGKSFNTKQELVDALVSTLGFQKAYRLKPFIMKYAYSKSNLEIVRFYNPKFRDYGEFGRGWKLLIPYRIEPKGNKQTKFGNLLLPFQVAVVNLLTGDKEELTFNTARYSIAGYVPDKLSNSNLVGLFILSNGSFRLADKLGNEFQFDQSGALTEMVFSKSYDVKFSYGYEETTRESFSQEPYRLESGGDGYTTVEVGNGKLFIPKKLRLVHGKVKEEAFVFSKHNRFHVIGYFPSSHVSRYKILAMMTDGSFVLKAKDGGKIIFDSAGRFQKMQVRVVKGLSQGGYKVEFSYNFHEGMARINEARLVRQGQSTPLYAVSYGYDSKGRLCEVNTCRERKAVVVVKKKWTQNFKQPVSCMFVQNP